MGRFQALFLRVGVALGGQVLACALCKLGLPSGLSFAIGRFARILITGEQVSEMVSPLRMMPTGSDSVEESGSSSWKKDLNLSSDSEGQGPGQDQGQGPGQDQGQGPQDQEHNEAEPASRKKRGTDGREDIGPSSVGPSDPYRSAALMGERTPMAQPPIQEQPVDLPSPNAFVQIHEAYDKIPERLQKLFKKLRMHVPGGFQAERLTEILEERHGGEKMGEILRSLRAEREHSLYFEEVKRDLWSLRHSGVTEKGLRREWQGRSGGD